MVHILAYGLYPLIANHVRAYIQLKQSPRYAFNQAFQRATTQPIAAHIQREQTLVRSQTLAQSHDASVAQPARFQVQEVKQAHLTLVYQKVRNSLRSLQPQYVFGGPTVRGQVYVDQGI